ncbi:hypothetical protein LY78DRAFT_728980 [Colletotrichum sublineola]|nr:hypothetical protein LY78DRAFT_728980 [Colletotrichum sublineola]
MFPQSHQDGNVPSFLSYQTRRLTDRVSRYFSSLQTRGYIIAQSPVRHGASGFDGWPVPSGRNAGLRPLGRSRKGSNPLRRPQGILKRRRRNLCQLGDLRASPANGGGTPRKAVFVWL